MWQLIGIKFFKWIHEWATMIHLKITVWTYWIGIIISFIHSFTHLIKQLNLYWNFISNNTKNTKKRKKKEKEQLGFFQQKNPGFFLTLIQKHHDISYLLYILTPYICIVVFLWLQDKIDLIHDLTIRGEIGRLKVMLDRPIWVTGTTRVTLRWLIRTSWEYAAFRIWCRRKKFIL